LGFQGGFGDGEGSFKFDIFLVLDYEWWIAYDGAYEFLLCDLFEVGESELGEKFLRLD